MDPKLDYPGSPESAPLPSTSSYIFTFYIYTTKGDDETARPPAAR
jgi:hypothetical protein